MIINILKPNLNILKEETDEYERRRVLNRNFKDYLSTTEDKAMIVSLSSEEEREIFENALMMQDEDQMLLDDITDNITYLIGDNVTVKEALVTASELYGDDVSIKLCTKGPYNDNPELVQYVDRYEMNDHSYLNFKK